MRQAEILIKTLESSGVKLSASDGKLKIDASTGELSAERLELLRLHKAEIIKRLIESEAEIIRSEREAIQIFEGQPSQELTWFDLCAVCKSPIYQKGVQWECPTTGCFERRTRGMR